MNVRLAAGALALALASCATLPPEVVGAAHGRDEQCRADYLGLDQAVAAKDAVNAGVHRIAGFPYLRSDRFLASFRDEAPDGPRFDAWVERLRALDLAARASELRNIGWKDPAEEIAHLDRCGKAWAARDLADPARRAQLRKAAEVPDDYSLLKRTLGLYPFAVPFLNMGINSFDDKVREDYARPAAQLDSPGPLTLFVGAAPVGAAPVGAAHGRDGGAAHGRDALGIPQLDAAQWQALATAHQPNWLLETGGDYDKPGALALNHGEPSLDAARPVTYFAPAYTRYHGHVLLQLVYVVWFSRRPPMGLINAYGGNLDGLVWRVTLDEQNQPLLYDTIHPCGCYHYYFSAQNLKRKAQGSFWDEPILFPQEPAPAEPFAIRLQSGTHYVRRLVPLPAGPSQGYALKDYEELLSLPIEAGGTRSLFCEDGLVCGTARTERLWLWMSGIESAGAMRQLGRHATSFVGRTHFDDPGMLNRLFE